MHISAANKYHSPAVHHEQGKKKFFLKEGQIKFLAVTIKQQIKLVLQHSLSKNEFNALCVVAQFHLQYFMSSQVTHNNVLLHLLNRSPRTRSIFFFCSNR